MNSSNNVHNTTGDSDSKENNVYISKENNFPHDDDVELSRMLNKKSIQRQLSIQNDLKCGIWIFQGPSLQRFFVFFGFFITKLNYIIMFRL